MPGRTPPVGNITANRLLACDSPGHRPDVATHPAVLGKRYRLIERIGAGGMAVVWRAQDEVLHRPVAVKLLGAALAAAPGSLEMLRREALAAASLSHPRITKVYDFGEEVTPQGAVQPFLVMELVEGTPLAGALRAAPQGLAWPQAVRITAQLAAALAAAHARGIVHRDVTPANVMLTADGVKVLDFGICVLTGTPDTDDELVGTLDYIAPERVAGTAEVTPACDVYALGIVLYQCLTGHFPWSPGTPTGRLRDHVWHRPQDLPRVEGLPDEVRALCLRCLAKNPADRPAAGEVATVLAALRRESAAVPHPPGDELTRMLTIPRGPSRAATRRATGPAFAASPEHGRLLARKPAVVTGVLLAAGLIGVMIAGGGSGAVEHAQFVPAAHGSCEVSYDEHTRGTRYDATMTVRSTTDRPAAHWRLVYQLAEGELVSARTPATLRRDAEQVAVTAPTSLVSGRAVTLRLSGSPAPAGRRPAEFSLDGLPCRSTVSITAQPPASPRDTPDVGKGPGADGEGPGKGKPKENRGKGKAKG